MSEAIRGGANGIHLMVSALLVSATSEEEREHLIKVLETKRQDLSDSQGSEEARKQFDRTIDMYLDLLKDIRTE